MKFSDSEIEELFDKVSELEDKYKSLLLDVKRLEEENVETTNCIYELHNRLDILNEPKYHHLRNFALDK
jgi:predicted nuclease with TOPRIM domain